MAPLILLYTQRNFAAHQLNRRGPYIAFACLPHYGTSPLVRDYAGRPLRSHLNQDVSETRDRPCMQYVSDRSSRTEESSRLVQ